MKFQNSPLSIEQKLEAAGRFFFQESQGSIASYYSASQSTISKWSQKIDGDPDLKTKALAAASLFYDVHPDKKPDRARSVTHPSAASRKSDDLTVMRAIPLPPLVPSQQVPAFTPSLAVPPGISMQPADLNVPGVRVFPSGEPFTACMPPSTPPVELNGTGAILVFPPGQAFISRPAWTVLQAQHQAPALPYVHAGQGVVLACTSQVQSEFHRPGASHKPVDGPPCVAPPNSAAAGDLLSF